MDDIEARLKETSETCLKNYTAWKVDQKSAPARETLHEAIHELRKVASRLEIELAVSERDQQGMKPMAIPPHRDAQSRTHDLEHDMPDFNTHDQDPGQSRPPRRMQKRADGGGGGRRHHGGGPRRPRENQG